jgi:WD40 repeat protein
MRWVWILVGILGLVGGCDRLPILGGEGEPCFGNSQCDPDADPSLNCVWGVCTDCSKLVEECEGKACGREDCCADCGDGLWCGSNGLCEPCVSDLRHCGASCDDCSSISDRPKCIRPLGLSDHLCGCLEDADCAGGEYCISLNWNCKTCDDSTHCGPDCVSCEGQATDKRCVFDGEGWGCGCEEQTESQDCAPGQSCDQATDRCGACQPDCAGRQCGSDGCDGQCAPGCQGNFLCDPSGQCVACDPDCASKACGELSGCLRECDGLGQECADGSWCQGNGDCQVCNTDPHCGLACQDCSQVDAGHHCMDDDPDFCGCRNSDDCPVGRVCQVGLCYLCTPDCTDKCDGADDGCGGTCWDTCTDSQECVDRACVACSRAAACGAGCLNCAEGYLDQACVQDPISLEYHCGCGDIGDCGAGQTCADGLCTGCTCTGHCGGIDLGCGACDAPCNPGDCCVGGDCLPSSHPAHCGPGCLDCSGQFSDHACVYDNEHRCGCESDADCADWETCTLDLCEPDCAPACRDLCGGQQDGCGHTCPDRCGPNQWCQAAVCIDCGSDQQHCGPDCTECASQPSDKICLNDGNGYWFCGCSVNLDCAGGEHCVSQRCQPIGGPRPVYELDLPDCSLQVVRLSGHSASHASVILAVGCQSTANTEERLWRLDAAPVAASPFQQWQAGGQTPVISALDFHPSTHQILSAYFDGTWISRTLSGNYWGEAALSGQVFFARWSPGGDQIAAVSGMSGMGTGTLRSDPVTVLKTISELGGPARRMEFTASGSSVVTWAQLMSQDGDGLAVTRTFGGYQTATFAFNQQTKAMTAPQVHADSAELASLSTAFSSGTPVYLKIWTGIDNQTPVARINVSLSESNVNCLAFLPGAAGGPSDFLLIGGPDGRILVWRLSAVEGLLAEELTATACGPARPIQNMAVSLDGTWLATTCANLVQVWDVAQVRTYLESVP